MATPAVNVELDFENLTDEQLLELSNKELAGAAAEPEAPAPVEEAPPAAPEKFTRKIDLGDGSGVQVFEADSLEALVDKLAEAQTNATRKIREQAQALKTATPAPAPAKAKPSADEEWVLGQKLVTNPTEAFENLFERVVGVKPDDFRSERERLRAFEQKATETEASEAFIASHEADFFPCPENGELMTGYLDTFNLPGTLENLNKAHEALSKRGLLKTKPADETPAAPPVKKGASGLSSKRSAATPPVTPTEPTEEDLYNMPDAEFEKLGEQYRHQNAREVAARRAGQR